jgi:hypothetical protein
VVVWRECGDARMANSSHTAFMVCVCGDSVPLLGRIKGHKPTITYGQV